MPAHSVPRGSQASKTWAHDFSRSVATGGSSPPTVTRAGSSTTAKPPLSTVRSAIPLGLIELSSGHCSAENRRATHPETRQKCRLSWGDADSRPAPTRGHTRYKRTSASHACSRARSAGRVRLPTAEAGCHKRAIFPPQRTDHGWTRALTMLARRLNPTRRHRSNPRLIKRKMPRWHVKRPRHADRPQPTGPPTTTIQPP